MKIAVLMPYRNAEKTVIETLESLKNQTYKQFELISVNNNSSDNSKRIIEDYCFDNNIYHTSLFNEDGEFSSVLNRGLFYILGSGTSFDFVARLDADDIWLPTKLEKQIKFLDENPDISILGTQIQNFSEAGDLSVSKYPLSHKEICETMFLNRNAIAHPSVIIRTNVFYRCGVYDDIYKHCEDYQYWMKASKYFKLANLPDVLVRYRNHINPDYNPMIPALCKLRYGRAVQESL